MFKHKELTVFGVYRRNSDEPFEVEVLETKSQTKRQAKKQMYDLLLKHIGISHRNIIKIFICPKNPY